VVTSGELPGLDEVFGREPQLETLATFIARIAEGPASLLLEGEPGIGKTTLWRAAVREARKRSYHVLESRPVGSDVQLAFAGLGDLVGPSLSQTLGELPPPQRRALKVALLLEDPNGAPFDQRAVALAVLGVLRTLSTSRPVLLAIDDAQWLDPSTAATLEFALRRLQREPIGALFAFQVWPRPGSRYAPPQALPDEWQYRLRVGPLGVAALHRLLRSRAGISLPRPVLLRIRDASGGNPFYALELARALEAAGGHLRPGDPIPIPERLHDLVAARLVALPASVGKLLLAVAASSDPKVSTLRRLMPAKRTSVGLRSAVAAGVLEVEGDHVSFTHPLIAGAVYAKVSDAQRRQMHRQLASVVEDAEAQARHLALGTTGSDGEVAGALELAAHTAGARGAPEAAAELLAMAAARTPIGSGAERRRRNLAAADAEARSGAIERAADILQNVLVDLPPGDERAGVLVRLATLAPDLKTTLDLGEQAEQEAKGDDALQCRLHLLLGFGWPIRGIGYALQHGRLALTHAERTGQDELIVLAIARLSLWTLWAGKDPSSLLARGLPREAPANAAPGYQSPRMPLALWRMYQGRLGDARSLFESLFAEATRLGDQVAQIAALGRLVDVDLRSGDWEKAELNATMAYELAELMGLENDGGLTVYWKALVDAHRGRTTEARSAARHGATLARSNQGRNTEVMNLGVLGIVEISLGNDPAALPHLRPFLAWLAETGLALAPHPLAPYALEALVAAGELDEARLLLDQLEGEARELNSPWALAIGDRCRGLVAVAEGDTNGALLAFERALARYEDAGWPFEHGRTLLLLGRSQRRAKRKSAAKQSLEDALTIFDRLGASSWSMHSRQELKRIGLRHTAPHELTEGERQVAELAASGLTNREVAARLFISPKTVEANLARAYQKLGIHSRAELGARLARGPRFS